MTVDFSEGHCALKMYIYYKSQKSETCKCCEMILKQGGQQEEILKE